MGTTELQRARAVPRGHRVKAIFDVGLTNRCNARCVMCPRDKTPEMGLMSAETYQKVLERAEEYGEVESFVFCGLGEPLLHPQVAEFVRLAADAGLRPSIVTNGALLTVEMSRRLVAAGVRNVNLSIGGYSRECYESVQRGLSFEKVYGNALEFIKIAGRRASLNLQISPTQQTAAEAEAIARFWRSHGARLCFIFPFAASRGGSLAAEDAAERGCRKDPAFGVPRGCINIQELFRPTRRDWTVLHRRSEFVCYPKDRVTFISWQGNYHLCCNDYEKQHSVGSVREMTAEEAYALKAGLGSANCALCRECDFVGGDCGPRTLTFYARLSGHYIASVVKGLGRGEQHPSLAGDREVHAGTD